jgi:hypothetical protein
VPAVVRNALLAALRATLTRIDLLADDDAGFYVAPETSAG